MRAHDALAGLWHAAGLPGEALGWAELSGNEPALPSSFAVGTAAQAAVAAAGLAAASLWRLRGGAAQPVLVAMRHAAAEFRSDRYLRIAGAAPPEAWDRIAGLYPTADGWVRLHTNFPHHRDGVLRLLGCAHDRAAVAAALRSRRAVAFEAEAAGAGLCVAALRRFPEWDAHPQAHAVAAQDLVAITRIGDAPPEPLPRAERPLSGLRVLDLTRVIAGPVCGRVLAAHGAEVMLVSAPHLPAIAPLVMDTGRGKLSAHLDLRRPADRETLTGLLRGADMFLQAYRPGALVAHGFGPERAAALRPGLICLSLSAYGTTGPWGGRRGFDSLVQTGCGLNAAEAEAAGNATPRPLPAQALDYASGYLLAFGAMAALHRRATEGGSWLVEVSLARTALWLRGLGRVPDGLAAPDPGPEEVADLMEDTPSGFGPMRAMRHPALLSRTPARWDRPSVPLGTHPPAWR